MITGVNKFDNSAYSVNNKPENGILEASEWNAISSAVAAAHTKIDSIIENGSSNSGSSSDSGVVSVNDKGNTTISAQKHINIEPAYNSDGSSSGTYGDVQIKPGDDITLESHHRQLDKRDEITIKTSNGQSGDSKAPVKLQVIAADMTLSSKGKSGDDSGVMNVNVTTGEGKGYLKVRARAIDLRCEDHGGIALQPKGEDSDHNMNKIKFEHGGGDGLEFGTFNTEKTSIFTDEYRFNKDGVWKMATRIKTASDKADENDSTTAYKYVKQADDFYDVITPYNQANDTGDEQCTTKDIIKTAFALNGNKNRHAKITKKGAIEISTNPTYILTATTEPEDAANVPNISTISTKIADLLYNTTVSNLDGTAFNEGDFLDLPEDGVVYTSAKDEYMEFTVAAAPDIQIESGNKLKLTGTLDFGSTFNFGETDNGIEFQHKLTAKNNGTYKPCDIIKIIGVNNHASNDLTVPAVVNVSDGTIADVTVGHGQTTTVASCSMLDVVNLVNYMKANNEGPWQQTQPSA